MSRLFFTREHMEKPANKGEVRESLKILQKVGGYDGLLSLVASDKEVSQITAN